MVPLEHSAILLTCIKRWLVLKTIFCFLRKVLGEVFSSIMYITTCVKRPLKSTWKPIFCFFSVVILHRFYCVLNTPQYVNWNKHPVPVPPSSRLIHYDLQHSCVTSCRKSWCESCWYSCNCEDPSIKIHFSIDLSNCYSYNHVIMYTYDCQFR